MWNIRLGFGALLLLCAAVSATAGSPVEDSLMLPQLDANGIPVDRWRAYGDFNMDGREDLLISEDIAHGNENGLFFAIYLRDSTGELSFYDSFFNHPFRISIEACGHQVRVWTYEYTGSGAGVLSFANVTGAGLIPGDRVELREGGRISQSILNSVYRNSEVNFRVQRSQTVAGKVQWVDDNPPLGALDK